MVNAGNVVVYLVMTGKLEVGTVARQLHAGAVAGQVEMEAGTLARLLEAESHFGPKYLGDPVQRWTGLLEVGMEGCRIFVQLHFFFSCPS